MILRSGSDNTDYIEELILSRHLFENISMSPHT